MPAKTAKAEKRVYREVPPPAALSGLVECCWRRAPWHPPIPRLGVLPDGRVDLLWAEHGKAVVIGPQTRALGRPVPAEFAVAAVRFRPGGASAILGVAAHELADLHVALDEVDSRPARRLLRALEPLEDPAVAPIALAGAIGALADGHRHPDPVIEHAARLLDEPAARVARVAQGLELSERQLERRFREFVGYGPKMFHRVRRFQGVLGALARGSHQGGGLARIAATAGYADQGHLTRETRELSGLTPLGLEQVLAALEAEGASGIFKTRGPVAQRLNAVRDVDGQRATVRNGQR